MNKGTDSYIPDEIDEFISTVGNNTSRAAQPRSRVTEPDELYAANTERGRHRMWSACGDVWSPCEKAKELLPSGHYRIVQDHNDNIHFKGMSINLDDLMVLPDNNSEKVLNGIRHFWTRNENFKDYGFLWKRGVLLWGPPGGGKTSTIQQVCKEIVDLGGVCFYFNHPKIDALGLELFRKIEPTRPILYVLEDVDASIDEYGESGFLHLLDGQLQINNIVFIATTNYPDKLDKRFINRPSRFDDIIKIGMPNAVCRKAFFKNKNPRLNDEELDMWVEHTDNFSVAHLKEIIVSVECLGRDFMETITRLKKMNAGKVTSEGGKIGFNKEDDED